MQHCWRLEEMLSFSLHKGGQRVKATATAINKLQLCCGKFAATGAICHWHLCTISQSLGLRTASAACCRLEPNRGLRSAMRFDCCTQRWYRTPPTSGMRRWDPWLHLLTSCSSSLQSTVALSPSNRGALQEAWPQCRSCREDLEAFEQFLPDYLPPSSDSLGSPSLGSWVDLNKLVTWLQLYSETRSKKNGNSTR